MLARGGCGGRAAELVAHLLRIAPAVELICSAGTDAHGSAPQVIEPGGARNDLPAAGKSAAEQASAGKDGAQVCADHSSCGDQSEH